MMDYSIIAVIFQLKEKNHDIYYYRHYNYCNYGSNDGLQYYSCYFSAAVHVNKKCDTWRGFKPASNRDFDAQPQHSFDTAFNNVHDYHSLQDTLIFTLITFLIKEDN